MHSSTATESYWGSCRGSARWSPAARRRSYHDVLRRAGRGDRRRLLAIPGWYGPIVAQVIDQPAAALLIETNPRFGSGTTCSIEAGLDSPRWILRECLGRPLPKAQVAWRSGLCMTRCRKDYFTWLS